MDKLGKRDITVGKVLALDTAVRGQSASTAYGLPSTAKSDPWAQVDMTCCREISFGGGAEIRIRKQLDSSQRTTALVGVWY